MKIIFCMPGKSYSREFLLSWSELLLQAVQKGHQVMMSQQYSSVVHFARSKCLGGDILKGADQKPFQGQVEYDAIMWVDSDIVFKPSDFFALLESPHNVTGGLYMMEDMQHFATVKEWNDEYFKQTGTFKFLRPDDVIGVPQYMKVAYTGMGWMLIRKGVIEKLKYPWFRSDVQSIGDVTEILSEDVSFCRALADAGHDIYVDTKIRVGHQKLVTL
jgi:hypothetical protein